MPLPATYADGHEDASAVRSEDIDEPDEERGIDLLEIMEAMSAHFHEHHEAIMRWSWKLFCRKWARLMAWAAEEREKERQREQDRAFEELRGRR